MEPALMMKTATCLLAITALGGLVMAGVRLSGKPQPPAWLAMLHGFLAGAAATLLLYAYFTVGLPALATWPLLLFLIAAAGGVFMIGFIFEHAAANIDERSAMLEILQSAVNDSKRG